MLTIYKASAGSGKTYTLAKSYILQLIGIKRKEVLKEGEEPRYDINLRRDKAGNPMLIVDNPHRSILAITFTRKATEEMKTRIMAELETLADVSLDSDPDRASKYAGDFKKAYGWSRQDMADAARLALEKLLYDYHNFNVSTIDSFFQIVMRAFARELNFQSDYNVEVKDLAVMEAAVGAMLDDFNQSEEGSKAHADLEKWITSVMMDKISDGSKSNLFNRNGGVYKSLVEMISKITDEKFKQIKPSSPGKKQGMSTADEMQKYLGIGSDDPDNPRGQRVADLSSIVKKRRKDLKTEIVNTIKGTFGKEGIDPENLKKGRTFGVGNFVSEIISKGENASFSAFSAVIDTKHGLRCFISDQEKGKVLISDLCSEEEEQAAIECLRKAGQLLLEYYALVTLSDSVLQLGMLANAWKYLNDLLKDNNLLLLSDTNHLLSAIIGDDETPFVYERMGVQLKDFLIDEFQDTSRMQWGNLRPLVSNGLAEDGESLVIGDEKQSIYRFRNSDSTILGTEVGQQFKGRKREKGNIPEQNTNYRSSPDVVKFNNTLCAILAQLVGVPGYGNVVQGIKKTHQGFVKFKNTTTKVEVPDEKKKTGTKTVTVKMEEEEILQEMAETIVRQINEGKYDQRDIAVLVSTNSEAEKVVKYLLQNYADKIAVYSDEALYLTNSAAVRRVISVLKIIDEEQNAHTPVGSKSKYPTRGEVMLAINRFSFFLSKSSSNMPEEALEMALDPNAQETNQLKFDIDSIRAMKPGGLLALVETVIDACLTESERLSQAAYLAALQDTVLDFETKGLGSLHAFLDWWETNKKTLTLVGDANANGIKVMTIHKSKGLEFECVHIPFCNWQCTVDLSYKKRPKMWVDMPQALVESLEKTNDPKLQGALPPKIHIVFDKMMSFPSSPFYRIFKEEQERINADTINKTYVAFTRAKTELHAWYKAADKFEKDSDDADISYLITLATKEGRPYRHDTAYSDAEKERRIKMHDMYSSLTIDLRDYLHANGDIIIGSETVKSDDEDAESTNDLVLPYKVYDIGDKRKFIAVEPDDDKDDNRLDENGVVVRQDPEAREFGITMHKIMEKTRALGDMEKAVAFVARRKRLTSSQEQECLETAKQFIALDPELTEYWLSPSTHALAESAIYIESKGFLRYPDLVVINEDNSVDIIDYKFTDNPAHLGLEDHVDQINEYASLLRDMGHYGDINTYICYPRLSKMLKNPRL